MEEKIKRNLPAPDASRNANTAVIELTEETEEELEENLETEDISEFKTLEELISLKKPQSKIDYLLLSAFYLQTREDLFKYSLKQLNSKLMPAMGSLVTMLLLVMRFRRVLLR